MANLELPPLSKRSLHDIQCQLCMATPEEIIDCKTKLGPWAHLCATCYQAWAVGTAFATRHLNLRKEV